MGQYSQEAHALQNASNQINARIAEASNRIDGLELEASNVQRQIDSIHVPTPDEDDPASVQAYQQAMQRIQMLKARRQNMLDQAALLREKRNLLLETRRQNEENKRRLACACRERADLIGRIRAQLQNEAARLDSQVKGAMSRVQGMRFSGGAGAAVQKSDQNAGWYRQAAQIMAELGQGFLGLAESLEGGEDRQKVKTLTR